MKKLTVILLTFAMLLSLTGCEDAISKLLYPKKDTPDAVEPKEPDIPSTTAPPAGDTPTVDPVDPAVPAEPVEPDVSQPEPDGKPAGGEADDTPAARVMASHTDVSLFYAGETFRFTVWDSGGKDPDACTYTTADPAVAVVDETGGQVTAVAPGITTVTAHADFGGEKQDFDCIIRCRWDAREPGLPGADAPETGTDTTPDTQIPAQPSSGQPSLSGFFSTLQGKYEGLGMMMTMDEQLLDAYYPGLSDIAAVEEVLIQETAISISNIAVGLVRLSDSATTQDILAVQSVLQSRITAQAEGGAYYPESCATWENGVITSVSNCVGMFVYPDDAHSMATLFTDTFGN